MLIDFRTLFPKYDLTFHGVLHVGANTGEEAPVYEELGIHKQIWIEANPEIFLKLKSNISKYPHAIAYNYCIGDEDKDVILHVSNNGSQSSSVLKLGTHRIEHPDVYYIADIDVPMRRIDGLGLELANVDLLNIDVQGFELNVLRGMGAALNQFKAVYIEINKSEVYEGCAQVEDLDEYLKPFGFIRVETHWARNKTWGDGFYIKA